MTCFARFARTALGLSLMVAAMAGTVLATPPLPTPEIDPGSIGSALTLLASGLFLLSGKSRKA